MQNIADSCKLLLSYLIFQDDAIEAGVRVLGCACDTDFTYTVSLDEANAEQCVGVQQWMTIGHDGQDFLGKYLEQISEMSTFQIGVMQCKSAAMPMPS